MTKILEELFKQFYVLPPETKQEYIFINSQNQFAAQLPDVQRATLDKLFDKYDTYLEETVEDSFIQGFTAGLALAGGLYVRREGLLESRHVRNVGNKD